MHMVYSVYMCIYMYIQCIYLCMYMIILYVYICILYVIVLLDAFLFFFLLSSLSSLSVSSFSSLSSLISVLPSLSPSHLPYFLPPSIYSSSSISAPLFVHSLNTQLTSKINLQAAKTNYDRELQAKDEQIEEIRRNLTKQIRELEAQLDDERKQRQSAQSTQKKIESELQDLENQLDAEAKGKEDAQRHYKKLHVRNLSS